MRSLARSLARAQARVQDPNFRRPLFIRRTANRCLCLSLSLSRLTRLPVETHLIEIPTFRALARRRAELFHAERAARITSHQRE